MLLRSRAREVEAPSDELVRSSRRPDRESELAGESSAAPVAEPLPDGVHPVAARAHHGRGEAPSALTAERRVGAILMPASRAPHG